MTPKRTREAVTVAMMTVIGLVLVLGVQSVAFASSASLIVSPTTFGNGTTVSISGSGFAPSTTVKVWFDTNGNGKLDSGEPSASVTTSASGTFAGATLLVGGVPDGEYSIHAGPSVGSSASFQVTVNDPTVLDAISAAVSSLEGNIATQLGSLQGHVDVSIANAVINIEANIGTQLSSLETHLDGSIGAAVTNVEGSLVAQFSTLQVNIDNSISNAQTSTANSISSAVTNLESNIGGQLSSLQNDLDPKLGTLQSSVNSLQDSVNALQNSVNSLQAPASLTGSAAVISGSGQCTNPAGNPSTTDPCWLFGALPSDSEIIVHISDQSSLPSGAIASLVVYNSGSISGSGVYDIGDTFGTTFTSVGNHAKLYLHCGGFANTCPSFTVYYAYVIITPHQ